MSSGEEDHSLIQLQEKIENLDEKLNQVIENNRNLNKKILELTSDNEHLYDTIYDIEVKLSSVDQYSRRSNIEICNIPEKIAQKNLEVYVLKVMNSIGVQLQSYDLVAVHRIGKFTRGKNRNVIIRFVNRKGAYLCLRDSKLLKKSNIGEYKKLYIIENLCPMNKNIFNYLYKLKKLEKIKNVWTYNGSVFYKMNDEEAVAERVDHMDDLDFMYNELSLYESESSDDEF